MEQEARFHDLVGGGRVAVHPLGLIGHVRIGAELPDGVEQHISPQVLHPAALVKKDVEAVREALGRGGLARSRFPGRRFFGGGLAAGANLVNQSINFL